MEINQLRLLRELTKEEFDIIRSIIWTGSTIEDVYVHEDSTEIKEGEAYPAIVISIKASDDLYLTKKDMSKLSELGIEVFCDFDNKSISLYIYRKAKYLWQSRLWDISIDSFKDYGINSSMTVEEQASAINDCLVKIFG